MTNNELPGGDDSLHPHWDEFAKMLAMDRGKFSVYLHDGDARKVGIREKVVLESNSQTAAASGPRRASRAELWRFVKAKLEPHIRQRVGLYGRAVVTVKDRRAIHVEWRSGERRA